MDWLSGLGDRVKAYNGRGGEAGLMNMLMGPLLQGGQQGPGALSGQPPQQPQMQQQPQQPAQMAQPQQMRPDYRSMIAQMMARMGQQQPQGVPGGNFRQFMQPQQRYPMGFGR